MNVFLFILLLIAMLLTVVALFGGLFVMARGGELNAKYGNKLMQARVIMQGIAIALFALVMMLYRS